MSPWPVAGPSEYWLLVSSPASEVQKKQSKKKLCIYQSFRFPNYKYTVVCVCVCARAYIYIYIYTHTHTHTSVCVRNRVSRMQDMCVELGLFTIVCGLFVYAVYGHMVKMYGIVCHLYRTCTFLWIMWIVFLLWHSNWIMSIFWLKCHISLVRHFGDNLCSCPQA